MLSLVCAAPSLSKTFRSIEHKSNSRREKPVEKLLLLLQQKWVARTSSQRIFFKRVHSLPLSLAKPRGRENPKTHSLLFCRLPKRPTMLAVPPPNTLGRQRGKYYVLAVSLWPVFRRTPYRTHLGSRPPRRGLSRFFFLTTKVFLHVIWRRGFRDFFFRTVPWQFSTSN